MAVSLLSLETVIFRSFWVSVVAIGAEIGCQAWICHRTSGGLNIRPVAMNAADAVFTKLLCHCHLISHFSFMKGIWTFQPEWKITVTRNNFQLCYRIMSTFVRLDCCFLQAGFVRKCMWRSRRCFLPFASPAAGCTGLQRLRNKSLSDMGEKTQVIILQKPDILIDGQQWVEVFRAHAHHLPQSHMIGNAYLPFHFNDVSSLQTWPISKTVCSLQYLVFSFFT